MALFSFSPLIYCKTKGIPASMLVECGLAIEKDSTRHYDRFRDRVIFPLCDLSGRIVAFAGRGMASDVIPKYLNSPETPLYQKSRFLYGLYASRQAIKENGFALIVEGYMDYLTLYQAGIKNVVASSGTAFTSEHAHLLQRFTNRVVLLFDGDSAGVNAAKRAIFILAPSGLDVSVLVLPGDEDPDEFVKKRGPEPFLELLKSARDATDFIIESAIAEHGSRTAREKTAVIDYLAPLTQTMKNEIAFVEFSKNLADRLSLELHLVQNRLKGNRKETIEIHRPQIKISESFFTSLEGGFLRILLTKPELIEQARMYLSPETLTDSVYADIYSLLLSTYAQQQSLDGLVDRTSDPEIKRLISMMLVKPALDEHIHEELVQKILHLRAKFLRNQIREIRNRLKREPSESSILLQQLKDYSTQLKELDERE